MYYVAMWVFKVKVVRWEPSTPHKKVKFASMILESKCDIMPVFIPPHVDVYLTPLPGGHRFR